VTFNGEQRAIKFDAATALPKPPTSSLFEGEFAILGNFSRVVTMFLSESCRTKNRVSLA